MGDDLNMSSLKNNKEHDMKKTYLEKTIKGQSRMVAVLV